MVNILFHHVPLLHLLFTFLFSHKPSHKFALLFTFSSEQSKNHKMTSFRLFASEDHCSKILRWPLSSAFLFFPKGTFR